MFMIKKTYETIIGVKTLRRNGNTLKESLVNAVFSTSHLLAREHIPAVGESNKGGGNTP